jgi:GDP-L-fucose synthase
VRWPWQSGFSILARQTRDRHRRRRLSRLLRGGKLARTGRRRSHRPAPGADYDLRDIAAVRQLLADTRQPGAPVDMVIHCRQRRRHRRQPRHPGDFFYDNLMMGAPLLHESWRAGIAKFVAIGTVCAYPKFTPIPFPRGRPLERLPGGDERPLRAGQEDAAGAEPGLSQQYGYNSIFLLPTNLYGPGDNFDPEASHVIPALIRKCLEAAERGDATIEAWGDGSPTREFLYVDDAAEGIVLAAERYDASEPVNLGSGFEISIKDLPTTIAR